MSIGILITNYNTWTLTATSIENCLKYADEPIDKIVVVDDCSSVPFENQFGKVTLIKNQQNLGLIKSLNIGVNALNTDLIVIFDSDAWPLENFVSRVKAFFNDNPTTGIATFTTENVNGSPFASYDVEPDAMGLILGQALYQRYKKKFRHKDKNITVYTCAMVIRKEVIASIGMFDEGYDWLELDHDICMRASRGSWQIKVMPIRALHKGSGTPQKVAHRVIRYYKNRLKLLKKFNKYPAARILNGLVLTRLALEYFAINTIGRAVYSKEVVTDKSQSRSELIKFFGKEIINNK